MRANMPRTSDRHVNEKPFRIALNLRESAPFYPLDLQKIEYFFSWLDPADTPSHLANVANVYAAMRPYLPGAGWT